MTTAKITYNDGQVRLECDGNPLAIMIQYEGIIQATSNLPQGFIIKETKNRIMILRLSEQPFPEVLFEYEGRFKIIRSDLYNNRNRITALSTKKTDQYYRIKDKYTELNSKWVEYGDTYTYGDISKRKTDIVTNNLRTTSGNLFLKDGTAYYGDVHFHSDGTFMTGGVHNEDSQILYRKKKKFIKNGIARKL
tara:strand:- start:66 stop:641 length:576 start_codon:yes stop_codon:yes gene_type:complete